METALTSALTQSPVAPFLGVPMWAVAVIIIWSLIWKGIALWKAARLSHKWWFIIVLVLNTLGIVEIIYIFFVAKKYTVETERVETPRV
ncbi:MAG: DUF5652 family protein [bacterium]